MGPIEDRLVGRGATRAEKALVALTTGLGVVAAVAAARSADVPWATWQWVLVLVVTVDVVGGVVANGLGSAKAYYHPGSPPGPVPDGRSGRRTASAHRHVVFAAGHLHPFVLVALLPGSGWGWAWATYGVCVVGVALVRAAPLYLERPVALAVVALVVVALPAASAPTGLPWFAAVLALKLVLAHAVREEPYRP